LFNKVYDLFKPSFENTVKSLNETVESLNFDLKKIQKPIDSFTVKLKELIELNIKLNKTLRDLEQVPEELDRLKNDFATTKKTYDDEKSESASNLSNPIQIKLKNDAYKARKSSDDQIKIAKDFLKQVNDNIRGSKASLDDLGNLIGLTNNLNTIKIDINYQVLATSAATLALEAQNTKTVLNENQKNLEDSYADLSRLNLDESEYKKDLEKADEKIQDFNNIVVFMF
jgi:chromosome segregation ATPase